MPDVVKRWSREEVLALPDDGNRYELIDGELLVSPSPRTPHQRAVQGLNDRVRPYVREHRLGTTYLSPADLDFQSGQVVQPDLFVVPLVNGREPLDWSLMGIPLLIAEVLSPSTARYDRITKRAYFQRAGVPDYWIMDIDARLVEHWRPGDERPEILSQDLVWRPDPALPPLVIDLPALFREVWAEA